MDVAIHETGHQQRRLKVQRLLSEPARVFTFTNLNDPRALDQQRNVAAEFEARRVKVMGCANGQVHRAQLAILKRSRLGLRGFD